MGSNWWWLFSRSVVSDSLRPHKLQHARLSCPSLSPGVCSNSCPLNCWCHPIISSSVAPFSSALDLYQPIMVFSQGGGSSHEAAKVLELQLHYHSFQWIFRIDFLYNWLVWSYISKTLKSLLQHCNSKVSSPQCSTFFMVQLSDPSMTTGKTIALIKWAFVRNLMSLLSVHCLDDCSHEIKTCLLL